MTPGVIPSKRHKLARNIGKMVGEHLLTGKDIRRTLNEERFQAHLHQLIDNRVHEALAKDLGSVPTLIPKRFRAYFKVATRTFKYQLREGVTKYLQSKEFQSVFSLLLNEQLERLGSKEFDSLVSGNDRENIYNFIDSLVNSLLTGKEMELWLASYLGQRICQAGFEGKSLGDHLPETAEKLIFSLLEEQAPQLLTQLSSLLADPNIRERIIQTICQGVDSFVQSLGPLASMVSGFLDMEMVEEKVRSYLDEKEEEIADWLQHPEVQEKFAESLMKQAEIFLAKPISEFLEKIDNDQLQNICSEMAVQLLGVLRSQGVETALSSLFRSSVERKINHGKNSLRETLNEMLGEKLTKDLAGKIIDESLIMLRSDQTGRLFGKFIHSMVDGLLSRPVGIVHDLMPAGIRKGLVDYIVTAANDMLQVEVPGIIDSLNIRQTVTDGALLGFMIGLLNLFVLQAG